MNRRRIVAGLVLGALAAGLVAGLVFWPRGTTEISVDQAVDDFRERTSTTTGAAGDDGPTAAAPEGATRPAAGVYRYEATGSEEVKLGPLPAENRPFPETVTAVAVDAADGCFDWTVNLFAEHTEDTRWCRDADGLRLTSHVKHQKIGALSPTATLSCQDDRVPLVAGSEADLACELVLDGGPASMRATLTGSASAAAAEEIVVGEKGISATPVTVTFAVSGDLTGSWVETTWWSPQGLPVQVERKLDLAGVATFKESSRLTLVDLVPSG